MVCLILTHNVIRIYHKSCWRQLSYCGLHVRFGIREKIRCGLRFFGVFLCGFAVFGPPLRPPSIIVKFLLKITSLRIQSDCFDCAQQIVPWVPEFSFSRATRSFGGTGRHVFGRRPKTRTAKPREKPRAQSALIYSAIWALTLSLICQSNRRSQDW